MQTVTALIDGFSEFFKKMMFSIKRWGDTKIRDARQSLVAGSQTWLKKLVWGFQKLV
jgi:hypothetical protein